MNKNDYELVPKNVLAKIANITKIEESRIAQNNLESSKRIENMENQAKHNKRVLTLYALNILINSILLGAIAWEVFK